MARQKKKKKRKREKGKKETKEKKKERTREERSDGERIRENMDISVSLFIVLGYLITMTGGKGSARMSVLACAKNSQDEDRRW